MRDLIISRNVFFSDIVSVFGETCGKPGERSIPGGNGVDTECASCRTNWVHIWSMYASCPSAIVQSVSFRVTVVPNNQVI